MSGLILLVFIAVLVAWLVNKFRRRLGLMTSPRAWVGAIVVVVVVVFLLWGSRQWR